MSEEQKREAHEIFMLMNNKNVISFKDGINLEDKKKNRIFIQLVEFQSNPSIVSNHAIAPDVLKVVCYEILNNLFEGYTEYKGSKNGPMGKPEARVLKIEFVSTNKYPFRVTINTGLGQVIGQGAVKMVKQEKTVSMVLSIMDMKRMAITLLDYIRNKERGFA